MSVIHIKLFGQREIRRFTISPSVNFEDFKKLCSKGNITRLSYCDDEGDWVTVSSEMEWKQAILMVMTANTKNKFLKVRTMESAPEQPKVPQPSAPQEEEEEEDGEKCGEKSESGEMPQCPLGGLQFEEFLEKLNDPDFVQDKLGNLQTMLKGVQNYVEMSGGWGNFLSQLHQLHGMFGGQQNGGNNQPNQQPNLAEHFGRFFGGRGGGGGGGGHHGRRRGRGRRGRGRWGRGGCNFQNWFGNQQQQQEQPQMNQQPQQPQQNMGCQNMDWQNHPWMKKWKEFMTGPQNQNQNQNEENQNQNTQPDENTERNFEDELKRLAEMGFVDKEINLKLLMKYSGDIHSVCNELMGSQ